MHLEHLFCACLLRFYTHDIILHHRLLTLEDALNKNSFHSLTVESCARESLCYPTGTHNSRWSRLGRPTEETEAHTEKLSSVDSCLTEVEQR